MNIDLSIEDKGKPRCLVLSQEIDDKLTALVKENPGTNKSMIVRKILNAYFEELDGNS